MPFRTHGSRRGLKIYRPSGARKRVKFGHCAKAWRLTGICAAGYTEEVQFEWDERKSKENLKKHRVSFEEARTVFRDPLA